MRIEYTDQGAGYGPTREERRQPQPRRFPNDQPTREQEEAFRASLHAQAKPLPEFTPQPKPYAIPAPQPERTETRMSIAQLRDRIDGMEATQRNGRNNTTAAAKARDAKITRYRAELARRIEAQAEANVAAAQAADGLTEVERLTEQLVIRFTSGAVIDAAWKAAQRIFHPEGRA